MVSFRSGTSILRHPWQTKFRGKLERGARYISIDNIEKLADALNIPVHELLKSSWL
jgi:hypothetical protein